MGTFVVTALAIFAGICNPNMTPMAWLLLMIFPVIVAYFEFGKKY